MNSNVNNSDIYREGVNKHYKYEKAPKRKNLIGNTLPAEMFRFILSTIDDDKDKQACTLVSRSWAREVISIEETKLNQTIDKGEFIDFLISCLEQLNIKGRYDIEIARFKSLQEKLEKSQIPQENVEFPMSLNKFRKPIFDFREELLDILKDIDSNDVKYLEDSVKTQTQKDLFLCKDFFKLVFFYVEFQTRRRSGKKKSIGLLEILHFLEEFVDNLVSIGHFNKAIEIVKKYYSFNSKSRNEAFKKIVKDLFEKGHFNKAIEIAKEMQDFRILTEALVRAGKMEEAIEVAQKGFFSDRDQTSYIPLLARICKTLVEEGELKKAYELAAAMPHKTTQNAFLHIISPDEYYKTHNRVHRD